MKLKKCTFCKRKENINFRGSIFEGLCSWCRKKHPGYSYEYNPKTGEYRNFKIRK